MEVIRVGAVPSTQDVARPLPVGTVVVAEHQTAGRGRLGRRWQAPPGAAVLGVDREELVARMAAEMTRWFAAEPALILGAWRDRSDTLGRRVRVQLPGETFEGVAEDIAADGTLIVDGRPFAAGDVVHLRPADK
jgi:BirA family biotin operon repressor/biotin-[acetyl-CoA-carboxylase] ligase